MRIVNKKKFVTRILEILVVIVTIILTLKAIKYTNQIRGYQAIGGEYLIPIWGLETVYIIEETYRVSVTGGGKHAYIHTRKRRVKTKECRVKNRKY